MMKSLNTRILWCWTLYCIVGCSLLPEVVMGARYLPTRRSIPTQLERNERLRELFQHILESERDAHLTAANQYADQLKLIQKKSSDFGMLPEPIKDYNDDFGDEYDERADHSQYDGRKVHLQPHQRQPWRFVLSNYGHGGRRNHKIDPSNVNTKVMPGSLSANGPNVDDLVSLNTPRSQQQQLIQKLYRGKQQKSALTNSNGDNEPPNDLDWITSTSELNSATDYDALLYDDVNERRSPPSSSSTSSLSPSSNMKFDRYQRRTGPLAQQRKQHLN